MSLDLRINVVESLAKSVGSFWKNVQNEVTSLEDQFYIASPLSSTAVPIYEWIVDQHSLYLHWNKVKFVLMDEQVERHQKTFMYIPTDDSASYERFANTHFVKPLQAKLGYAIPVIKPPLATIDHFDLQRPIDLLILAIGVNGHYAQVMPDTKKATSWHIAKLTPEFRNMHTQNGSNSYEGAYFRECGMSLGPQEVMKAKHIAVIISGERKRSVATKLFSYNVYDPSFPCSIIHDSAVKDNVTVFLTSELADTY